jgi:hypothetical protein
MRSDRDKAIEAAARALLGLDASDIRSDPRAALDAALALPDAPAPAPSERERALVREALARGTQRGAEEPLDLDYVRSMVSGDEVSCVIDAVDASHPPTDAAACAHGVRLDHARACVVCKQSSRDAAAAERAEIVRGLRERARLREEAAGLTDSADAATRRRDAAILHDLADRIAARGPAPVWTDERLAALVRVSFATGWADAIGADEAPPVSDEQAHAIIARVRAGT